MPPRVIRARWVLPIDRPAIRDGWVQIADGRIIDRGSGRPPQPPDELGDVAVLPGLVNAHTHLELSWLAGRVPPADSLVAWIRRLMALRRDGPAPEAPAAQITARSALAAMRATGTVLVGDVSNTLMTRALLAGSGVEAVVLHELIGFTVTDAALTVREAWRRIDEADAIGGGLPQAEVAAHAPYSVAPALLREIARQRREGPLAVHVAESSEEIEFLRTGRGPFRDLLEDLGVWTDAWRPPGAAPLDYLAEVGYLQPGLLAVHGVHLSDDALEALRDRGGYLVTCPRSNEWVGAGLPRLARAYAERVPVAIGTDSLASTPTLNLFDELAALRRIAPDVSAACLLESATRVGAEALGFAHDYGTLEPGRRAVFAVVDLPAGTPDVEEYLVSGVPAGSARRLDDYEGRPS